MMGLQTVAEQLAAFFRKYGVNAVAAWPCETWEAGGEPVATVELKRWEGGPAGLKDYLGERWNEEKQAWEELYGSRAKFTFAIGLYSTTAADCLLLMEKIAGVLQQKRPDGLTVQSLTCGETKYDRETGRFLRQAELTGQAFVYAAADESGVFLTFEVRGELNP